MCGDGRARNARVDGAFGADERCVIAIEIFSRLALWRAAPFVALITLHFPLYQVAALVSCKLARAFDAFGALGGGVGGGGGGGRGGGGGSLHLRGGLSAAEGQSQQDGRRTVLVFVGVR
jgi:hypothetical protein